MQTFIQRSYLLCVLLILVAALSGTILAQDDVPIDPTPAVPIVTQVLPPPPSQVSGLQTVGRTEDIINLRSGAGTTFPVLTTLPINTQVIIEARNAFGNWIIVHTTLPTGVVRGWAAARYVSWSDAIDVREFSASAELIVPGVPPAPPAAGLTTADTTVPAATVPTVPTVPTTTGVPVEPSLFTETTDTVIPLSVDAAAIPAVPVALPPLPADTTIGRTQDILNVRAGASTSFSILEEIAYNTPVLVEGRNDDGRWFLIRTQDNRLRGWVAARYVSVSALVDVEDLTVFNGSIPVSQLGMGGTVAPVPGPNDLTGNPAVPPVAGATGTTGIPVAVAPATAPVAPTADLAAIQDELALLPILPTITEQTRAIYQRGLASGANPRHFIKVGVNVINNNNYLSPIGRGQIVYGAFGWMDYVVNFFQGGDYNAWVEPPVLGANTGGLLDSNSLPLNCPAGNQTPIDCAAATRSAAFAIIYTGSVDSVSGVTPDAFSAALNGVVSRLASRGTIPLLTTLPIRDGLDRTTLLQYNKIIIDTAAQYGVPVLNYYRIALDLPQNGLDDSGVAFTSDPNGNADFTTGKDIYGYTALTFYTAWALSTVLGGL